MSSVFKLKQPRTKRDVPKLFAAVKEGNANEVDALLSRSKSLDINSRDEEEWTPLFWAAFNGHREIVQKLLKAGAWVNVNDKQGRSPLYLSCGWGDGKEAADIPRDLIEARADVNQVTVDGWSALYLCAFRGKAEAVKLLLESRADIFLADSYHRTPVEIAKSARHKGIVDLIMEEGGRLLCSGAEAGDVKLCRKILENHLADINAANSDGWTALHFAVKNDNEFLVKSLIEHNANTSALTKTGIPLLQLAKSNNNMALIDLLSGVAPETPFDGTLCSVKEIRKKGEDIMKVFSDSQRDQCLQSEKLKNLVPYIKSGNEHEAVYVALGAILTSETALAGRFRSSDWTDLDEILDQLVQEEEKEYQKQQNPLKELAKVNRMRDIELEVQQEVERQEQLLSKNEDIQEDEFSYQTRDQQDVFDELIISDGEISPTSDNSKRELLERLLNDDCPSPHESFFEREQRTKPLTVSADAINVALRGDGLVSSVDHSLNAIIDESFSEQE